MHKARILAEATDDVVVAMRTLEAHGIPAPWRDLGWHVALRVGEELRYNQGEGGVNTTIRRQLLKLFGSSPAVVALAEVLPKDQLWTRKLLAPVITEYFGLVNAEGLRQSLP